VFFASFGSTSLGVAFGAHLGGFAFGAVAGMTLKLLGLVAETAPG
jgi:membrane associated rhomboid family serine protease